MSKAKKLQRKAAGNEPLINVPTNVLFALDIPDLKTARALTLSEIAELVHDISHLPAPELVTAQTLEAYIAAAAQAFTKTLAQLAQKPDYKQPRQQQQDASNALGLQLLPNVYRLRDFLVFLGSDTQFGSQCACSPLVRATFFAGCGPQPALWSLAIEALFKVLQRPSADERALWFHAGNALADVLLGVFASATKMGLEGEKFLQPLLTPRGGEQKKDGLLLRLLLKLDAPLARVRAAILDGVIWSQKGGVPDFCARVFEGDDDRVLKRVIAELAKAPARLAAAHPVNRTTPRASEAAAAGAEMPASFSFGASNAEPMRDVVLSEHWKQELTAEQQATLRLLAVIELLLDNRDQAVIIRKLVQHKAIASIEALRPLLGHCFKRNDLAEPANRGDAKTDSSASASAQSTADAGASGGGRSVSDKADEKSSVGQTTAEASATSAARDAPAPHLHCIPVLRTMVSVELKTLKATAVARLLEASPHAWSIPDLLLLHPQVRTPLADALNLDAAAAFPVVNDQLALELLHLLNRLVTMDSRALPSYPRLPLLCRALVELLRLGKTALPECVGAKMQYFDDDEFGNSVGGAVERSKHGALDSVLVLLSDLLRRSCREHVREPLLRAGLQHALERAKHLSKISAGTRGLVERVAKALSMPDAAELEKPDVAAALHAQAVTWADALAKISRNVYRLINWSGRSARWTMEMEPDSKEAYNRSASLLAAYPPARDVFRAEAAKLVAEGVSGAGNLLLSLLDEAERRDAAQKTSPHVQLNADDALEHCANAACGKLQASKGQFRMCGRCRVAKYCSPECQKAHWKGGHKKACATAAAAGSGGSNAGDSKRSDSKDASAQ